MHNYMLYYYYVIKYPQLVQNYKLMTCNDTEWKIYLVFTLSGVLEFLSGMC